MKLTPLAKLITNFHIFLSVALTLADSCANVALFNLRISFFFLWKPVPFAFVYLEFE